MRRRLLQLFTIVFTLSISLPIKTAAWGGYVSVSGEKTFHIMYCEELIGTEYNKLRWYDTLKQAQSSGRTPCELCGADDWFDFEELDESYFVTNDHKLDAAFDAAIDYGHVTGYENGYEIGWEDAMCAVEYSDNPYDTEISDHSFNLVEPPVEESTSNKEASWFLFVIGLAVLYGVFKYGVFFGEERNNKTIGRLHTENMELRRLAHKKDFHTSVLTLAAKECGVTVDSMIDSVCIGLLRSNGYSDSDARVLLEHMKEKNNL